MQGGGAVRKGPVLVVLIALLGPLVASQPWPLCDSSSGNYSSGSVYQANLLQLITNLQSNASSSPSLFATGSAGGVYGLMQCRGDVSSSDCFDCGTWSGRDVQRVCNRSRDVALEYNQCYVRISDRDFLASTDNSGEVRLISGNNISSGVDVAAYDRALTRLHQATVEYAVENSTRMFATGRLTGLDPRIPDIWSTAQCAADLSRAQCRTCLHELVARWFNVRKFLPNGDASRISGSRCHLRSQVDRVRFYTGEPMVTLRMNGKEAGPAPEPTPVGGKSNSVGKTIGIVLPVVLVAVLATVVLCMWNVRKKRGHQKPGLRHQIGDFESIKSTLLSLSSLQAATDNFSENNKLGEGGFGSVYKGVLSGQEVAVKRLSKGSDQGLEELKNELVLVAKLHHKNLVRLEGFCLEEGEKLLVYEYMANKSLDTILFEPEKKRQLNWKKRFNIIEGVARGLQYLHEDSQKKIVHRDLKASNILLDADMNPKIGDFGLARLFGQNQTRDVTNRIVGTFGYMSPEYVMRGQYSTKSDVFSFGILVIEIITGQRNSGHFFCQQNKDIVSIVWKHWSEGTVTEIIDDSIGRNHSESEVLKCMNIGLLCLQQNPVERPTMSDIMVMLNGDSTSSLPPAVRPTFFLDGSSGYSRSFSCPSAIAKAGLDVV